ncbi:MAG TPA: tetratricopeptide repeat protein [Bacteroidales bacterium]|nr:tetratricopeptide repeat protein [Bacteroidales bacterium]
MMKEKMTIKSLIRGKSVIMFLLILLIRISVFSHTVCAQADKKFIRQGNREYEKSRYSESEILYRKALDKNKQSADAVFNAGDALYKQEKYEDAGKQFIENINLNEDRNKKSAGFYNLGNSFLKSNKLKESIDAYKNSLRLNPQNLEAKYNLAYAQDLLQQQQQQQQNQDQQQQKQDKNNQDQNKEKEQDQSDNKEQQDQQQQPQQDDQAISKEDAERILNALENDEKNVQEKVKLAKAAKNRVRSAKNW